jgi:putative transposase
VKETTVSVARAAGDAAPLPARVQEALGQLVGAAKEGLLALSVGVGLSVLSEMLEAEVDEVVGPKASTTRTAPRCVRATRPARSRSAGAGWRSSARACAAPTAARRCRLGVTAPRRPRPTVAAGARTDARRRLHPPLPAHQRAGRQRGRGRGALDVEVRRFARVRRAHAREPRRAREPPLDDVRLAVMMIDAINRAPRSAIRPGGLSPYLRAILSSGGGIRTRDLRL